MGEIKQKASALFFPDSKVLLLGQSMKCLYMCAM